MIRVACVDRKVTLLTSSESSAVCVFSHLIFADDNDMFRLWHDALVRPDKNVFGDSGDAVSREQSVVLFHAEGLPLRSVPGPVNRQRASAND